MDLLVVAPPRTHRAASCVQSSSRTLALVIAGLIAGGVVTLRVAHAVGRVSCGHHVAGREGGRDRRGEAASVTRSRVPACRKPACRGR